MIGDLLLDQDWRDAVRTVEARIPPDVVRRLAGVRIRMAPGLAAYADAGAADIRLRPGLGCSQAALVGIVAHEAAHILLGHHQALHSGVKALATCEGEADRCARALGFGDELDARRMFYGR